MSLIHLVRLAVILVSMSVFVKAKYWDRSITILLAEGQEDCYFLPNVKATNEVDVEYQVCIREKLIIEDKFYINIKYSIWNMKDRNPIS